MAKPEIGEEEVFLRSFSDEQINSEKTERGIYQRRRREREEKRQKKKREK